MADGVGATVMLPETFEPVIEVEVVAELPDTEFAAELETEAEDTDELPETELVAESKTETELGVVTETVPDTEEEVAPVTVSERAVEVEEDPVIGVLVVVLTIMDDDASVLVEVGTVVEETRVPDEVLRTEVEVAVGLPIKVDVMTELVD